MKLTIDGNNKELVVEIGDERRKFPLYSDDAFRCLSEVYLKVGWNQKYSYGFSWLGRPIIQLPEDIVRIQELIYSIKPDVIVETGVAHGGSLIFYASLLKAIGSGRVIGVDIEIRPHNREAIESHVVADRITLVEGSSTDEEIVEEVRSLIGVGAKTLVILNSDHSYSHVMNELRAYAPMVSLGSYIVATDGVMRDLADVPNGKPEWVADNPARAARDFLRGNSAFRLDPPRPPFLNGVELANFTYWPDAYLRRIDPDQGT